MREIFTNEVIIALISAVSLIVVAFINKVKTNKLNYQLSQANNEMSLRRDVLSFSRFTSEWNETLKDLTKLMEQTEVDRFLILTAWNGSLAPNWTTASFQLRSGNQQYVDYIHAELDNEYREILRNLEVSSYLTYKTKDIKGLIKDYYEAEGVVESAWFFIDSKSTNDGKSRAITYCSFASHKAEGFNDGDVARCRAVVGRLKQIASGLKDAN